MSLSIHGPEPKWGKNKETKHSRPSNQQRLQEDWKWEEVNETTPKTEWKRISLLAERKLGLLVIF